MDVAGLRADGSVAPVLLRTAFISGSDSYALSLETWWPLLVDEVSVMLYLPGNPVGTVPFSPCPNEFYQFPQVAEISELALEGWCSFNPDDDERMPEPLVGTPTASFEFGQAIDVVFPGGDRYRADEIRITVDSAAGAGVAHADIRANAARSLRIGGIGLGGGCRADWNDDGEVNSRDLFDYLSDFFGGRADFNADGTTNSQDLFDSLAAFFGGCR